MENTEKRLYEGMFVLPQTYVREDQKGAFDLLSETLEKFDAEIRHMEVWAERSLAYEINHVREVSYVLTYFDAPAESVAKIERQFRITDNVLRVLIVKPARGFNLETFLAEKEKAAQEEVEEPETVEEEVQA